MAVPYFRSNGQTYRIKLGGSVTITCVVENLGEKSIPITLCLISIG